MSFPLRLKLSALSYHGEPVPENTIFCEFGAGEKITIGRNITNRLALDDPSRVISRVQASVECINDSCVKILNLSASTSIFINAREVIPGADGVLYCSDSLMIGAYVFALSSCGESQIESELPSLISTNQPKLEFIPDDVDFFSNKNSVADSLHLDVFREPFSQDPPALSLAESGDVPLDEMLGRLLVDKGVSDSSLLAIDSGAAGVFGESSVPGFLGKLLSDSVDVPAVTSHQEHPLEIESPFVTPQFSKPTAIKEVKGKPAANLDQGIEFAGGGKVDDACRHAFARALQLEPNKLPAFTPAFFEQLGGILLHLTAGTVNMMHERAQIKHEMRADVTIIAASGNNPLKFAPDAQSAISHLLGEPMPGFMRAKDAIDDAMDDLLAHQIGLLSGSRAAVYEVVKNFSPEKIQKYLAAKNIIDSLLPMAKKARLWELYEAHYGDVAGCAKEEFELRFQQAFAQAYEQEIDRMCEARESA